jgi:hypothetical protein
MGLARQAPTLGKIIILDSLSLEWYDMFVISYQISYIPHHVSHISHLVSVIQQRVSWIPTGVYPAPDAGWE